MTKADLMSRLTATNTDTNNVSYSLYTHAPLYIGSGKDGAMGLHPT